MSITIIVIVIIALLALWLIYIFNSLVTARNRTEEALSDIEVQQKRRYDLIPNLVATVKGYATHEEGVLSKVTEARAAAMHAGSVGEHVAAENMLTNTLKSLFAVSEAYPDLKASQNFLELQRELLDAEDKIQAARRFYNQNARDFNTRLQTFPQNIIGNFMGFKSVAFYDAPAEAEQNVKVEF